MSATPLTDAKDKPNATIPAHQVKNLVRYVDILIGRIERTFEQTGEVDYFLCDKIEALLWPKS